MLLLCFNLWGKIFCCGAFTQQKIILISSSYLTVNELHQIGHDDVNYQKGAKCYLPKSESESFSK